MNRDELIEWIDEHTIELGITNYPYVSVIDLKDFLSSQPSEVEITKGMIEEYLNETLKDSKGPIAREFRAIFGGCIKWLDRQEVDE